MKIHIYDQTNKNKLFQIQDDKFLSIEISRTIDDFATVSMSFSIVSELARFSGFENFYLEDDKGDIIFGGVLVSQTTTRQGGSFVLYDHRWMFTKLILDNAMSITENDNILDKIEELVLTAKAKRYLPFDFDREGSQISNTDLILFDETGSPHIVKTAEQDLKFEIGDDYAGCFQKIIQTIYARWAIHYTKIENEINGKLVVRSIIGVTPNGIGISYTQFHSEDPNLITLSYTEGGLQNNINDFTLNIDLSQYTSRVKVGATIDGESQFVKAEPNDTSAALESYFGTCEGYVTDYRAKSLGTALAISSINQTYIRTDMEVILSPGFDRELNCGDRVAVYIKHPMVLGLEGIAMRIDAMTFTQKNGYLEKKLLLNAMSPQKRTGAVGLLQAMTAMYQQIDGLDKNYINS